MMTGEAIRIMEKSQLGMEVRKFKNRNIHLPVIKEFQKKKIKLPIVSII